jgi:ketosteroid isomerase-like protein
MVDWDTPEGPLVGKVYQDHLDSKGEAEVAQWAFDAWQAGESSGDYSKFRALLADDFEIFSHPITPDRGVVKGTEAKKRLLKLIEDRRAKPNQLRFSNVRVFQSGREFVFQFDSEGKIAGSFPYRGWNTVALTIADGKVVGFREYLGDVDPKWFAQGGGK